MSSNGFKPSSRMLMLLSKEATRAKTWVDQVRDIAYDVEDIINTYIFKIHQHHRGSHGCFSSLMTTYACHPSRLTILHNLGNEIAKVKRRTEEIFANRSKYQQLVESMSKQFTVVNEGRMNKLKNEELKKMVYEHLKDRKYLVETDDVWTRRDWDNIKEVLPEMTNGSKVLLTTRNREVALHADRQIPLFDLKLLGEEDSWELFCKKVAPHMSYHC
ncbi:disease resistance RPP8-like protein 3 [Dioscorea cayenensis subsp. rotundata]|uniref:Disease resistance RPP8-like protein 3 n=1 Tax=Dioscorea cayennensis subsp. rotundata TaxID=55577 RepID=A0AB40BTU7_DIOCR|nr:disease resistance RPP8-like protein 3 [Dioscorea cayenensis subsp. rotundata]